MLTPTLTVGNGVCTATVKGAAPKEIKAWVEKAAEKSEVAGMVYFRCSTNGTCVSCTGSQEMRAKLISALGELRGMLPKKATFIATPIQG